MASPLHRIEPRLLTVPQLYGSAGEPSLDTTPTPSMPPFSRLQSSQGPSLSIPLAALAMLLGGYGKEAKGPQIPLSKLVEKPNDEPLDVMPDSLTFSKAFGRARKLGLVEFTWRGKPYTTELKGV